MTGVALVTGGTGGIGSAICQTLCRDGYRVVTTYSNEAKARQWQDEQRELGFDFAIFPADVRNYEQCLRAVLDIEEVKGPIEVLVNCAGITRDKSIKKLTPEMWQQVIDVNLTGVFNFSSIVAKSMLGRGYGRIINISSINGRKGQFGQVNYAAAKAGIHGLTMSLAQELAPHGITVNTLAPGYVATEMVTQIPAEILERIVAQIPVGRLGQPQEIARAVSFLASRDAAFITGSELAINGGQHMY
ncbi:acetoacetyl-CoA reductase [Shewanella cyperi]|uniref:Acetoacetyl-CoA reductase n=1 Tax=Shewanella cyperi TaxID=2814292 RepID=A0A975AKW7_9GAMM|nr:acetoacetyl-CoA reductase [Shewanella cyperi]QSX30600.1 acetoacetyl-CoA reductase [Shewanella cyperi]